jgi:hypothetical protein
MTLLGGILHVFEFGVCVYISKEKYDVGTVFSMRVDPLTHVVTYAADTLVVFVSELHYTDDEHNYVDEATHASVVSELEKMKSEARGDDDVDFFDRADTIDA